MIGKLVDLAKRPMKKVLRPFFPITGQPHLWREVRAERKRTGDSRSGMRFLRERFHLAELPEDRQPIFVFSPIWRSGSTLAQRLLMSDDTVWMWGEVYARLSQVQRLSSVFESSHEEYPFPDMFPDTISGTRPEDEWIPNLSPKPRQLLLAHRAYWDTLLAKPARAQGYLRWGFKEVHLSVVHAWYLRELYPDARIVFLVRSPYAAWLSYYRYRRWYARYPDWPIVTVQQFGQLWRERTDGFLQDASEAGILVLQYEDLTSKPETVTRLEQHTGTSIDRSVLAARIRDGSAKSSRRKRTRTGWLERKALQRSVEPTATDLGYEPH